MDDSYRLYQTLQFITRPESLKGVLQYTDDKIYLREYLKQIPDSVEEEKYEGAQFPAENQANKIKGIDGAICFQEFTQFKTIDYGKVPKPSKTKNSSFCSEVMFYFRYFYWGTHMSQLTNSEKIFTKSQDFYKFFFFIKAVIYLLLFAFVFMSAVYLYKINKLCYNQDKLEQVFVQKYNCVKELLSIYIYAQTTDYFALEQTCIQVGCYGILFAIFILDLLERKANQNIVYLFEKDQKHRSIMFKNLPETTDEEIIQKINQINDPSGKSSLKPDDNIQIVIIEDTHEIVSKFLKQISSLEQIKFQEKFLLEPSTFQQPLLESKVQSKIQNKQKLCCITKLIYKLIAKVRFSNYSGQQREIFQSKQTGKIIITFTEKIVCDKIYDEMKNNIFDCCLKKKRAESRGKKVQWAENLYCKRAPRASEIIWDNVKFNKRQLIKRWFLTWISLILMLGFSLGSLISIQYLFQKVLKNNMGFFLKQAYNLIFWLVINLFNFLVCYIMGQTFTQQCSYIKSRTYIQNSVFLSMFYFINSCIVPYSMFIYRLHKDMEDTLMLNDMTFLYFGDLYLTPLSYILDPSFLMQVFQQWIATYQDKKQNQFRSQDSLNQIFMFPKFALDNAYAEIIYRYFTAMFYLGTIPLFSSFMIAGIGIKYQLCRHQLLSRSNNQEDSSSLYFSMVRYLPMGPIFTCVGIFSFYSILGEKKIEEYKELRNVTLISIGLMVFYQIENYFSIYERFFGSQKKKQRTSEQFIDRGELGKFPSEPSEPLQSTSLLHSIQLHQTPIQLHQTPIQLHQTPIQQPIQISSQFIKEKINKEKKTYQDYYEISSSYLADHNESVNRWSIKNQSQFGIKPVETKIMKQFIINSNNEDL